MFLPRLISVLALLLPSFIGQAQESCGHEPGTVNIQIQTYGSAASPDAIRPLWSYSRQWGIYSQYSQNEAAVYAKAGAALISKPSFTLNTALAAQLSTDSDRTMLHEACLKGKVWNLFDYTLGLDASSPIAQYGGGGALLMSDNARPLPRAGAGFFNWTPVPFTGGFLDVKGSFYLGWVPDGMNASDPRAATFTSNPVIHEKHLYLRSGKWAVKPYFGLVHSVMVGGTLPDGTKNPFELIRAVFGKKASEEYRDTQFTGEVTNCVGGHMGMWDLGFEFETAPLDGTLYYRRLFCDASGENIFRPFKDYTVGLDLHPKNLKALSSLSFEVISHTEVGGPGLADPSFYSTGPVQTGERVWLDWYSMSVDAIHKYFDAGTIAEWEGSHGPLKESDCKAFFEKYTNHGYKLGGRDNHYANGAFLQGWTAGGLCTGCAYYFTDSAMERITGLDYFSRRFPNQRILALTTSAEGGFDLKNTRRLTYKATISYTRNQGDWWDPYSDDFWEPRTDYYFNDPKTQIYTGLWLGYGFKSYTVFTDFFYDCGQMYRSFATRAGLKVSLSCKYKHNQ